MSTPSGATGLLAGAISYALGVCTLVEPGDMALPTPCPGWDLGTLLVHLSDSIADLETAVRTGHLDLERPGNPPAWPPAGNPVDVLRDRAAELLSVSYCYVGPERFVAVGGLPVPVGLVVCTGAVEIAVHGWDVSSALGACAPIPAVLATRPVPAARGRPRRPVRRPGEGPGPGQPG